MQLRCPFGLGIQFAQSLGFAFATLLSCPLSFGLALALALVPTNSVLKHLVRLSQVHADL